ncbi:MAG: hypothetical protein HY248_02990, partial [Fimbriimonas ginsengisoli]|nr:hypothetical protein [Fimbriimonas ginsengisoli]
MSVCEALSLGALKKTVVLVGTEATVAVKVALLEPAGMEMDGGIVTLAFDELTGTSVFACTAVPRLRVHELEPGDCMVAGVQIRLAAPGDAVMLRVAARTMAPALADMVTLPEALAATAAV